MGWFSRKEKMARNQWVKGNTVAWLYGTVSFPTDLKFLFMHSSISIRPKFQSWNTWLGDIHGALLEIWFSNFQECLQINLTNAYRQLQVSFIATVWFKTLSAPKKKNTVFTYCLPRFGLGSMKTKFNTNFRIPFLSPFLRYLQRRLFWNYFKNCRLILISLLIPVIWETP